MKKTHIVTQPTRRQDLSNYDDLFDEDDNWQAKSARMQARRWRKIKHQLA